MQYSMHMFFFCRSCNAYQISVLLSWFTASFNSFRWWAYEALWCVCIVFIL